jgi:hypothetical protein
MKQMRKYRLFARVECTVDVKQIGTYKVNRMRGDSRKNIGNRW